MNTLRGYIIGVIIIIAVVLGIAWFYNGGEHFKGVSSVCYGFLLGWLSGAFIAINTRGVGVPSGGMAFGAAKIWGTKSYRQGTREPGWQDRTRSTHVITFDRRPSLSNALNETLTQDLNAFLQTQTFPDLYRAYAWKNDTYANGFPDIYGLESRLVMMDQTSGITLLDVKCLAKWGAMRNPGRISREVPWLPSNRRFPGRVIILYLRVPRFASVSPLNCLSGALF